jgi:hypothetical protein
MADLSLNELKKDLRSMLLGLGHRGRKEEYLDLVESKVAVGRESKYLLEALDKIDTMERKNNNEQVIKTIEAKMEVPV